MTASWMQFASGWQPTELHLHPDGGQLNEICIRLAANQMQILQKYAASTLLCRLCFASTLGLHFLNYNM
jgi:hypothetical protein